MNLSQIVEYVKHTPNNTNPMVLQSILDAEVDSTLKIANEYTDSQRLGYVEHKTLKFDGTLEDMTLMSNGMYIAKVSNEVIDLKEVKQVKGRINGSSRFEEIRENNSTFQVEDHFTVLAIKFRESSDDGVSYMPIIAISTNEFLWNGIGTYFFGCISEGLTGYINEADIETIHQIPQEYFPVFDSVILNGLDGKKYKLYINEAGEFATAEVI